MKYTVKADLRHDQLGRLRAGQIIEATDLQAGSILEWLEPYDTKVVQERPKQHADGALAGMPLLRKGNRLSVTPVSAEHWAFILGLE